jgi:hypothetical protein
VLSPRSPPLPRAVEAVVQTQQWSTTTAQYLMPRTAPRLHILVKDAATSALLGSLFRPPRRPQRWRRAVAAAEQPVSGFGDGPAHNVASVDVRQQIWQLALSAASIRHVFAASRLETAKRRTSSRSVCCKALLPTTLAPIIDKTEEPHSPSTSRHDNN